MTLQNEAGAARGAEGKQQKTGGRKQVALYILPKSGFILFQTESLHIFRVGSRLVFNKLLNGKNEKTGCYRKIDVAGHLAFH